MGAGVDGGMDAAMDGPLRRKRTSSWRAISGLMGLPPARTVRISSASRAGALSLSR